MAEKDQNTILPWQRIAIEGFQEIVHVWGCRTLSGLCKDGCLAQGTLMKLDPRCPDGSIRLETVVKMTGRLMTPAHVFFKGEKQQEVLGTLGAVLARPWPRQCSPPPSWPGRHAASASETEKIVCRNVWRYEIKNVTLQCTCKASRIWTNEQQKERQSAYHTV